MVSFYQYKIWNTKWLLVFQRGRCPWCTALPLPFRREELQELVLRITECTNVCCGFSHCTVPQRQNQVLQAAEKLRLYLFQLCSRISVTRAFFDLLLYKKKHMITEALCEHLPSGQQWIDSWPTTLTDPHSALVFAVALFFFFSSPTLIFPKSVTLFNCRF